MMKPIPLSSSAIPTTTPKSARLSAMKETFSAVESAVAVTQVSRAAFEIGFPASSVAAAAKSFVPVGVAVLRRVAAQLRVGQAAGRLERVDPHVLREAPCARSSCRCPRPRRCRSAARSSRAGPPAFASSAIVSGLMPSSPRS